MIGRGMCNISIGELLEKIDEPTIIAHYFGVYSYPKVINAPYRNDSHPSLGLTCNRNKVYFTDFATQEKGGTFNLLMKTWNLSFHETISKVYRDIAQFHTTPVRKKVQINNGSYKASDSKLECKVREWRSYDDAYWNTYGISRKTLIFGDVYPISHIIVTKGNSKSVIPAEKYAYAYVERKDGKVTLKIYQPFSKNGHKWFSKHDGSTWDLWTKLPAKGDRLIITSSRKDALCIIENTNIPSICMQGEGYLPKPQIIDELKKRFNEIYILYDNDFQSEVNNGRLDGRKIAECFNLRQIEIPEKYMSKDPSDLVKNHGRDTLKKVISELINGYYKS